MPHVPSANRICMFRELGRTTVGPIIVSYQCENLSLLNIVNKILQRSAGPAYEQGIKIVWQELAEAGLNILTEIPIARFPLTQRVFVAESVRV